MTLVRRTNRDFDSLFSNFFGGDFFINQNGMYNGNQSIPAVNIAEDEEGYQIEIAVPGLAKEDINIEFDNGKLTISSNKKETEPKKYTTREFNYEGFKRTFSIPKQKVDDSNIVAKYENGVLQVVLPKREEVKPKPAKFVEIQ